MRLLRFVLVATVLVSCKKSPMGRVESLRDELASDSPRFDSSLAACGGDGCAADVAKSIGGAFEEKKPDQISAAAVAVVVARDRRGSAVRMPDVWIAAMRKAKGPGADALRLATALEMSRVAEKYARPLDTDADARAFLADVAASIPGACTTYASLGAGADPNAMSPVGGSAEGGTPQLSIVDSPDHSACVQRDLSRRDGPGGGYGQGLFRGAAGALALWKETAKALREGEPLASGEAKSALDRRLATIEAATPKIAPKFVAAPAGNTWGQMEPAHETKLEPVKK